MPSKYLIYALVDPRDGAWRYIGKSSSGMARTRQHFMPSYLKHDTYKGRWIRSLLSISIKPTVEILEEIETPARLAGAEMEWIAEARRVGIRLTNLTDGGDGTLGWKMSEETKRKIGDAQRGEKNHSFGKPSKKLGTKLTPEQKVTYLAARPRGENHVYFGKKRPGWVGLKISASKMGHAVSEETRVKIAQGHLGIKHTVDSRRNMSIGKGGGRPFSDENGNVYFTKVEAADALGVRDSNVGKVLRGLREHTGGHTFRYLEEGAKS